MEFLPVVMTFVVAYGIFLAVGYFLAKLLFPSQEDNEDGERTKRVKKRELKEMASQ